MRDLWRQNRVLLVGFAFGLIVTLFFAVRLVVHAIYWSQHRDSDLAEWMTIGYVAQSYHIERDDLARAVGLEPGSGRRLTIAEIARRTDQSVDEVETVLLSAIQAERAKDAADQQ
jgi:hypothetical protein